MTSRVVGRCCCLVSLPFLEEVVAFVIDDNKRREVFNFYSPDGLHTYPTRSNLGASVRMNESDKSSFLVFPSWFVFHASLLGRKNYLLDYGDF